MRLSMRSIGTTELLVSLARPPMSQNQRKAMARVDRGSARSLYGCYGGAHYLSYEAFGGTGAVHAARCVLSHAGGAAARATVQRPPVRRSFRAYQRRGRVRAER